MRPLSYSRGTGYYENPYWGPFATIVIGLTIALLWGIFRTDVRDPAASGLPRPLVLLEDGTLLSPDRKNPLSEPQKRSLIGSAFLARDVERGRVLLVTAAHVARHLPFDHTWVEQGEDVAFLKSWPASAFPGASELPEIGWMDYGVHRAKVVFSAWDVFDGRWAVNEGFDIGADDRAFPLMRAAAPDESQPDIRPGFSGSPVYRDGRVVGVLCGGKKGAAKYDPSVRNIWVRYQLLY